MRLFLFAFLLSFHTLPAAITFEPNYGQTDPRVRYLARTAHGIVFITDEGIVLNKDNNPVTIAFGSAGKWQGAQPTGEITHYMVGRSKSEWIHGIPSFQKLTRKGVFPGIDLELYANAKNQLEYDLIVAPGSDTSTIRIRAAATLDPNSGDLMMAGGAIRQHRPVIFQGKTRIDGSFQQIGKDEFRFAIAEYDHSKPLTIDPVIESREYLGGLGSDTVASFSRSGGAIGTTSSIDFPGAPLSTRHGTDIYYRFLQETIIIGGRGDDNVAFTAGSDATVDFIAGTTTSRDLPTTDSSLQRDFRGGETDGFVIRVRPFSPPADRVAVTYFGSSGDDQINAAAGSGSQLAIVGTTTNGSDFPKGFAQNATNPPSGGRDAFAASGNWNGNTLALQFTTLLGGSGDDYGLGITLRPLEVVVAGETTSPNFPTVGGTPLRRSGPSDAFVARLNSSSAELKASLLVGGQGFDRITMVANRIGDNTIFATGATSSPDFPLTSAFQAVYGGGASDAFILGLKWDLAGLTVSSFIGGSGPDEGTAIAVGSDSVFVAGNTSATDFPIFDAIQARYGGGSSDGFWVHANGTGQRIQSTYYGGAGEDRVLALRWDNEATATIGGTTTSATLPGQDPASAPGESRLTGPSDGFVATISSTYLALPKSISAAKHTWVKINISAGDKTALINAKRIEAVSADPSKVLVSFLYNPVPAESAVWLLEGSPAPSLPQLQALCIADSGMATVSVSMPGYTTRTVNVSCTAPRLSLALSGTVSPSGNAELPVTGRLSGSAIIYSDEPGTGLRYECVPSVAPAFPFPAVTISRSNPVILDIVDSASRPLSTYQFGSSLFLRPLLLGQTTVTLSAPGAISGVRTIDVLDPFGSSELPVVSGFGRWDGFETGGQFATVRSLDPDKVLLSMDTDTAVSASISSNFFSRYLIRGLPGIAPGSTARLEMSMIGLPARVARTIRFVTPAISALPNPADELTIPAGARRQVFLSTNTGQVLPPNAPTQIAVTNSSTAIVSAPASVRADGFMDIVGIAAGTATLSVQPPAGFSFANGWDGKLRVRVTASQIRLNPFDLGIGLIGSGTATLPGELPQTVQATVSTTTPNLLQIAATGSSMFGDRFNLNLSAGTTSLSFRAKGLAKSGTGRVTVEVPGFTPVTVDVFLRPSGFVWASEALRISPSTYTPIVVAAAALDPVSGLPLAQQLLGDSSFAPQIGTTNAAVAIYDSNGIQGRAAGQALLTIRQPAGFDIPVIRQRLVVNVGQLLKLDSITPNPAAAGPNDFTIAGSGFDPATVQVEIGGAIMPNDVLTWKSASQLRFNTTVLESTVNVLVRNGPNGPASNELKLTVHPSSAFQGSHFVPIAPCRAADTRPNNTLARNTSRDFTFSNCGIPANATAVALNVTLIPSGPFGFLTIWPSGGARPTVSLMNSLDGRIKANASIVGLGSGGAVSIYVTDATDVALDVNGYFVPAGTAGALAFYPLSPCRVIDTRTPTGGGIIAARGTRRISGGCLPPNAQAYALNVTTVPPAALGYLTLWPDGSNQPTVSTLNNLTGTVVANAAILRAGNAGAFNAFVTDASHLIADLNGYFAPPGSPGALSFYPSTPCRIFDTRNASGAFGGPSLAADSTRTFTVPSSRCGIPAAARAYVANATVLPSGVFGFLTLWPSGQPQPTVSTLNAVDGALTSNAAIVLAGPGGSISAYTSNAGHMLLDISGFFAP